MTILYDSRVNKRRDIVVSFSSVQTHEGQITYYNPRYTGEANYLTPTFGVARRFGVHAYEGGLVWRVCHPNVSNTALRTEVSFNYENNSVTRYHMFEHIIPADGPDLFVDDQLIFTVIGQLHEQAQPNGGRNPPWQVDIFTDSSGLYFKAQIAHDGGLGGSGTSGFPNTLLTYDIGRAERGKKYRFCAYSKAAGVADDFLKIWIDGVLVLDYSGYVGYPDGNANWFKWGSYTFFSTSGVAKHRCLYNTGVVIGDEGESLSSMNAYFDGLISEARPENVRYLIAGIGGTNVLGSGAGNSGAKTVDPVSPSVTNLGSLFPGLSEQLFRKGISAKVFNCAYPGAGIVSYVGRCAGTRTSSTKYVPGESVTPSSAVGVTSYMENGLKFICVQGGTTASSAPTWPTTEYQQVTDGTVIWESERRETYDTAGHYYQPGELGFDPLGLTSQAMICLHQQTTADKKILIAFPGLDSSDNVTGANESIAILQSYLSTLGITVINSSATTSAVSPYSLGLLGRAIADAL